MSAYLIAEDGPLKGLILSFEEGEDWIIGRDPDVADLVIEDSTVSRKHARATKTPQGIFLQNVSRVNPILINEEEPMERTLLKEGDQIQIGNQRFRFSKMPIEGESKEPTHYEDAFGEFEEPPPPPREEVSEEIRETPTPLERESEDASYDTIFEDLE